MRTRAADDMLLQRDGCGQIETMEELNSTATKRLTMRVARGNILFIHPEGDMEMALDCYPLNGSISVAANLRRALSEKGDALTGQADSATVMIDAPVMLVPIEEFQADEAERLFRYAFTSTESMEVATSVMPSENVVALFGLNRDLKRVVSDNFASVRFFPLMQSLWRLLHKRSYTGQGAKLFAYFHEKKMEVCAFRHAHFRYQNAFEPVSSSSDALYYLMNIWQQQSMKADADELILLGNWPFADEVMAEAHRFVSRVRHLQAMPDLKMPRGINADELPLDLQASLS